MKVELLSSFPPGENPFCHDHFNMGQTMGKNVTVMFGNHSSEEMGYLIVVNTRTGERIKITFEDAVDPHKDFQDLMVPGIKGELARENLFGPTVRELTGRTFALKTFPDKEVS